MGGYRNIKESEQKNSNFWAVFRDFLEEDVRYAKTFFVAKQVPKGSPNTQVIMF